MVDQFDARIYNRNITQLKKKIKHISKLKNYNEMGY